MSAGTANLTPQEVIARDRIVDRVAAAHHGHHVPRQAGRVRRHVRAALLLRSLAERLDPTAGRPARAGGSQRPAGPRTGTAEPAPPRSPPTSVGGLRVSSASAVTPRGGTDDAGLRGEHAQ